MIKLMMMIAAKPDIAKDDFIHYYETVHAPLSLELLPSYARYVRNYVDVESYEKRAGTKPDFTVITEVWFDTDEDYEDFKARCADPAILKRLRDCEENFSDLSKTRIFMVDERTSEIGRFQRG